VGMTSDVAEPHRQPHSAEVFSANIMCDCGGDKLSGVIAAAEAGLAHTEVLSGVDTAERTLAAVTAPKPVRRRHYQQQNNRTPWPIELSSYPTTEDPIMFILRPIRRVQRCPAAAYILRRLMKCSIDSSISVSASQLVITPLAA